MACFLIPAGEAIITTIAAKALKSKEGKAVSTQGTESAGKLPFSRKLNWLSNLLWGGSALLAFEHLWHGEISPAFPFLTAAANPADAAEMLHEMSTVGITMALLVSAVWGGMLAVSHMIEKRSEQVPADAK